MSGAPGNAAVISPVGKLRCMDEVMTTGPVAQKLYDTIIGIQTGKIEEQYGWRMGAD